MGYTNDAFATMLLTMALLPNREEYARPYSTQEFKKLEERVRESELHHVGKLSGMDISGLMMYLGISEEEAYRIYTLLNRSVQLTYAMDSLLNQGIEVITVYNEEYPARIVRRMGNAAPPFCYRCGNAALMERPAIAILGISGVKTMPEVRDGVVSLVRNASAKGYAIITGGELGVSRVAANAALECGGVVIDVLGGGMAEHVNYDVIADLLRQERAAILSLEHPEAMFTVSHAIARNKVAFALADAAFICSTDCKRGETDALHNRYCDWIYAWSGYPANNTLIARGATPVTDLRKIDFDALSAHWRGAQAEQMNMFDLF